MGKSRLGCAWVCACLVVGCTGSGMARETPRPVVDGGAVDPLTDAGPAMGIDAGPGSGSDGGADGGVDPGPVNAPGGPVSGAPIVGCEDAERPARRSEAAEAVCEAVGGGVCWYVSPEGDDANPGSFEAPFGTAQAAAKLVGPGDVIYLRGGVYGDDNAMTSRARVWDDPSRGVDRSFLVAGTVSLPGWAGGDNYNVASGTADGPITVRSLPGERACISGAGSIRIGSQREPTGYWYLENVTIHEGNVEVAGTRSHDIHVAGNEIYDYTGHAMGNYGLIRVNRGGAHGITVESNILHEMYCVDTDGVTRDWATMHDAQHFGSVATLSCETYEGFGCAGNGELTVRNNHIYHVPQAFFLKNPAVGPFNLVGNVIHDTGSLGKWAPSNITFEDNLVYGGIGSIGLGGSGGSYMTGGVYELMGRNLVVRNNTFVGVRTLVQFRIYASGHTVRGNVFQGLQSMSERSWDNMGYIVQGQSWVNPDSTAEIADSQLAKDNDFDDNCFVTADANFLAFGRRYDAGSGTELTHLSLEDGRSILSYELTSDVVASAEQAFVDAAGGDYRSNPDFACAGRGAAPPAWAQP